MPILRPEEEAIRRLLIYHPRRTGWRNRVPMTPLPSPSATPSPSVTPSVTPTITPTASVTVTPTPTSTPTPSPSVLITYYLQTAGGDDLQTAGGDNLLWTV